MILFQIKKVFNKTINKRCAVLFLKESIFAQQKSLTLFDGPPYLLALGDGAAFLTTPSLSFTEEAGGVSDTFRRFGAGGEISDSGN